jgi:hypothetical protein
MFDLFDSFHFFSSIIIANDKGEAAGTRPEDAAELFTLASPRLLDGKS